MGPAYLLFFLIAWSELPLSQNNVVILEPVVERFPTHTVFTSQLCTSLRFHHIKYFDLDYSSLVNIATLSTIHQGTLEEEIHMSNLYFFVALAQLRHVSPILQRRYNFFKHISNFTIKIVNAQ